MYLNHTPESRSLSERTPVIDAVTKTWEALGSPGNAEYRIKCHDEL